MTESRFTRRNSLGFLAVVGAAAALGVALPSTSAQATQFHMDAALVTLKLALRELNNAAEDKGGHRKQAIELLQGVIAEVERGIRYAEPG